MEEIFWDRESLVTAVRARAKVVSEVLEYDVTQFVLERASEDEVHGGLWGEEAIDSAIDECLGSFSDRWKELREVLDRLIEASDRRQKETSS